MQTMNAALEMTYGLTILLCVTGCPLWVAMAIIIGGDGARS